MTATQSACTSGAPEQSPSTLPDDASSASREQTSPAGPAADGPRILLAYFSRAGENYYYGGRTNLEVGNTEVLARLISARLGTLDLPHVVHKIDAAEPYPFDYDEAVARNVREQDADARPEISNPLDSIDGFDLVLLGSPIWNVRPPMIMRTFAERYDFAGKTVHPFTTHAMSGLGTTESDYAASCRNAHVAEGLAVRGEEVRDAGPAAVTAWLKHINPTDE